MKSTVAGIAVARRGRWLVVDLGAPHALLSSAIVGGGRARARTVAWLEVRGEELRPPVDARRYLRSRMAEHGIGGVGMLTSRDLDRYVDRERRAAGLAVRTVATVGLGNALRVGDAADGAAPGTINLLCVVSTPLRPEALVEALSIAAEARTAAVLEADVPSRASGRAATGTGTDCIVVASCRTGRAERYAGKHTTLGALLGQCVHEAILAGALAWKREQTEPRRSSCG